MPLAPHPPLAQYRDAPAARQQYVNALFDAAAPHYERIVAAMSLGTGQSYRRDALDRHGLAAGQRVLDVATGTGLVARCAREIVGAGGCVVGLDPSRGMLEESRRGTGAALVQSVGEVLPFGDAAFDFLTMGYALRHVPDLERAFGEYRRVLQPGGRVLILEISRPESRLARRLACLYFGRLVPVATRLGTGSADAQRMMKYYWDTIEHCVSPETILTALGRAGFTRVERYTFRGIFNEYSGTA